MDFRVSKTRSNSVFGIGTCLLVTFLSTGCGEVNVEQPTYPASGEVRLDGKPLKGATVVFHAIDKSKFKWQEIPQAVTDENGKFNLFTYSSNDGAPAAEYKVAIALMQATNDDGGDQVVRERASVKLPAKYADHETSGIKATIEKRSTSLAPFELSSK
jgi:hypothetical protein